MDIKKPNEDQDVNWEYIPDINVLLEYLDSEDLMELSKCCKRYRNQLERRVFENLDLVTWCDNNVKIYEELIKSKNTKKVLEYMKTDLGSKLKFVKKFAINMTIDYSFAETFGKLLPNIKTLVFDDWCVDDSESDWEQTLITALNSVDHLEYVKLDDFYVHRGYSGKQIFPKSLKSLDIYFGEYKYENQCNCLKTYERIDASYINLYSLTIVSNKMLENLAIRMQNLQEVEVDVYHLDKLKLIAFLKANLQLRKIYIESIDLDEEILKILLSSKCLENWRIDYVRIEEIECKSLPSNYSIKHLKIHSGRYAPVILKLINACKNLENLDIDPCCFEKFDLLKFERKINILKVAYGGYLYFYNERLISSPIPIFEIDASRLFNQVHFGYTKYIEEFIKSYNIDKLKNYKFIPLISGYCTLKLINKD